MSVSRNIGFLGGIISKVDTFARVHNNSIQPIAPLSDRRIETTALKSIGGVKDSSGASGTFHWGFHKWGDVDNVVGA